MIKVIQQEFEHIKVFGKDFTKHHKEQIEDACRNVVVKFTNWIHYKGFYPAPHEDYKPRYWYKKDKYYTEDELWLKFINDKKVE